MFCKRMHGEEVDPAALRIEGMSKDDALAAITLAYGL